MVEGHVGIENEVANMSPKEQLMSSPAHFMDIATGEPIPNARCIHVAMRGDSDIVSSWKTKTCGGDCLRSDLLPILDDR